ncbi:cupin domain-containing protein [Lacisediminimonas sp.]|uniref:cupin domain-containing protein n=1 Tax=Lacisediminimonas sp. TaxID=3060582 RepID=UPI00272421D2|nr:cupin [Lacisediminimonas sp.]MDO8300231.1 cupin [Lacisediminimonas sp.]MDO9215854.1 cupin [Lacisediminimonas sp.]
MTPEEFTEQLSSQGYEVVPVRRGPGSLDVHTHPFEAKALIVAGEIAITTGDTERLYRVGDIFHLLAGVPHAERYGPAGVEYLAGRKG